MDRQIIYPGQVPLETDLLLTNKNTMIAVAKVCAAILGVSAAVSGFATTQSVVPALSVLVAAGEIYSLQNIDGTAYSSLAADTTHSIVKQGISLDPVTLAITPPGTAGFSINYLIQVGYQDSDTGTAVLPYYNASNPSIAYSGPANSGTAQPTKRAGIVSIQAKAGTAATTGTQTTPAPDAGYTGLFVVTVANGASTVVNGNISALATAPFINSTLHGLTPAFGVPVSVGTPTALGHAAQMSQVAGVVGTSRNLTMSVSAASATATLTADEIIVETALGGLRYCLPSFSKTINLATTGAGGMDTGAAPASGFVAIYAIFNPTTGVSALLGKNASTLQTEVYSGANMPAGYGASALIGVWPTNASSQLLPGVLQGRKVTFNPVTLLSTTTVVGSLTLLSIATWIPANAKFVSGTSSISFTTTAGTSLASTLASSAGGIGALNVQLGGAGTTINRLDVPYTDLALMTAQTIWYSFQIGGGTGQGFTLQANSYTF
ncbi:hypothetical protein [Variovorax sp. GB1P17]|uniref:hypothetical protein n=1 Tax=Variovorax sp. GB1P17 TaxID=3443740 RepID=UPI003F48F8D0